MIFKNLFIYYLAIFLPVGLIALLVKTSTITPTLLFICIMAYVLIYHPLVSGLRLVSMGRIPRSKFFYNFIPAWNTQYFSTLFFGKSLG